MVFMDKTHKVLWPRLRMALLFTRKAIHRGGLVARLPIVAVAAIAGLGLFCGNSQAGRWLSTTENPYCSVSTYTLRDIPEQATSMLDSNGRPMIVVNFRTLHDRPTYGKFLMAHECCHHTLGHVRRHHEGLGHLGPQPFFFIAPQL